MSECYLTLALLERDVENAKIKAGVKAKLLLKIYAAQDKMMGIQQKGATRLSVINACLASGSISKGFVKAALPANYEAPAPKVCRKSRGFGGDEEEELYGDAKIF